MRPALPQGLDPATFDAFHDDPGAWRPAIDALVRGQGWAGDWQPAGEGTVLVALLGTAQVLKCYPPFLRDHAAFERAVLGWLPADLGVATPRMLAHGKHDGWPWVRMTQLPGRLLLSRWPHMPEPARLALLERLGALVAAWQSQPVGALAALAPRWTDFVTRQRAGCRARQQRTGLPAHLLASLEAFLDGPLPEGPDRVLTGEFTPMNLLVDETDALGGLFDFGDGLIGPAAYDWLGPLCFLCAGQAARVRAFEAGLGQALAAPEALLRLLLLHRYSHLPAQLAGLPDWQAAPDLPSLAHRLFAPGR